MGTQQVNAEELARLLKAMDDKLTRLETELTAVKEENEELRSQLNAGPSASGPAQNESLAATITWLLTSEKKAKVPKPHDYDGDRQKLPTFAREAETYIVDQGLDRMADTEKAINIIAGYLTGAAATWYTTAYLGKAQNETFWESREEFWRDLKARFGEADPTFSARTRLSRLKQDTTTRPLYKNISRALIPTFSKGYSEGTRYPILWRKPSPQQPEKKTRSTCSQAFLEAARERAPTPRARRPRQPTRRPVATAPRLLTILEEKEEPPRLHGPERRALWTWIGRDGPASAGTAETLICQGISAQQRRPHKTPIRRASV